MGSDGSLKASPTCSAGAGHIGEGFNVGLKARKSGWNRFICCVSPDLLPNQRLQLGNSHGKRIGILAWRLERMKGVDMDPMSGEWYGPRYWLGLVAGRGEGRRQKDEQNSDSEPAPWSGLQGRDEKDPVPRNIYG